MTDRPWPDDADALEAEQRQVGALEPPPWVPPTGPLLVAGCFVAFARGAEGPGHPGDRAWVAAVVCDRDGRPVDEAVVVAAAGDRYRPGLLALREGPMLEAALERLEVPPDVVLVDATGREHPRRCGLAVQLGARLDRPVVGVTHRPLTVGLGGPPELPHRGDGADIALGGEVVARWVCTRDGVRPLVAHAGWRTDVGTATELVVATATTARTPEPLRLARDRARTARARATGLAR